jgi:hypothetical protein
VPPISQSFPYPRRAGAAFLLAVAAIVVNAIMILPVLAAHHFDLSTFIVAGDRFVDARHTASPIAVRAHSDGYDGQFFYRLALDPVLPEQTAYGVTLDRPSFRMARIGYPALAWLVSLGRPAAVPAALFWLNLLGLGAIAALSTLLARAARLPIAIVPAIVLWPGFLVALMHDTAEIAACAIMLAAILCAVRGRFVLYAALAALATLTRETTVPVFAGLLLYEAAARRSKARRAAIIAGVLLFLPFLAWNIWLTMVWHTAPEARSVGQNLQPIPLAGLARMLADCITGARTWAARPSANLAVRGIVLVTTGGLIAFCCVTASRLRPLLVRDSLLKPLGVSWALLAIMLAFLKASGPWIEPAGYLRAFSECYVTGCLVLASSGSTLLQSRMVASAGLAVVAVSWVYCTTQIGWRG